MRLRQVALVAKDLEPHVAALKGVLGLNVAYRDPGVGVFGLVNAVFPVGGEFLEIVQPVKDDASAARYLKRRGGDAGYMVILQADDAIAHRARVLGLGVRKIWEHDSDSYQFTHFHPGDFTGVLTSIDSVPGKSWQERDGLWPPAGKDWRAHRSDAEVVGLSAVTIQTRNKSAVATRWAELLDAPITDGSAEVRLGRGTIRFTDPVDSDGTGVVSIDVEHRQPEAVLKRAKKNGLPVDGNAFRLCGIAFNLVAAH
jgi:glyoxalase-like protein